MLKMTSTTKTTTKQVQGSTKTIRIHSVSHISYTPSITTTSKQPIPSEPASFYSIPPEIIDDILIHLPISPQLADVGFSSHHLLAPTLFYDFSFARRHLKHYLKRLGISSIWEYWEKADVQARWFLGLPITYQAAFLMEILNADLNGSAESGGAVEDDGDDEWEDDGSENTNSDLDNSSNSSVDSDEDENELNREGRVQFWLRVSITPKHAAKLVDCLIQVHDFDLSCQRNRALVWACRNGWVQAVESLLQVPTVDVRAQDNGVIRYASRHGYSEIVKMLLPLAGVDPTACDNYPILRASAFGHVEVVELLLKDGRADPTVKDNTPIGVAAANGHSEVVKALLKDGRANPDADNRYAIHTALFNDHLKVVQVLLDNSRMDPIVRLNLQLSIAANYGRVREVQWLLKDVRVDPSYNENYPLQVACASGYLEVVKVLWNDPGVDLNEEERDELLELTMENGHDDIVNYIMGTD